jgi:hypothetical protein
VDGTLTPDFRGVLETDDGATVLFAWQGYARSCPNDVRELVGSITHVSDDDRFRWLNDRIGAVVGEVRPGVGGGSTVAIEVREIVWEPLETNV